jgi:hypothetical protein
VGVAPAPEIVRAKPFLDNELPPAMSNAFELVKGAEVRQVWPRPMSELQIIEAALQVAARRRRWARALRGLWWGLLVGAISSLLMIGVWHLLPLPLWTLTAAALVPFPCALTGMIIGGWHKTPLSEVARWVDGHQHLQERLSTALEVAAASDTGTWRDLVVTDAAEYAQALDPRRLVPFRLSKATRWALVILAVGAGLGFVPEYRSKAFLQMKADQQNIKEAGKRLVDLTRRTLEKRPPALEPTQKALEAVSNLGDQLTKKAFTRSEALKDLANVAEKLKDELKEMGKDPALRKMEQAARAGTGNDAQTAAGLQIWRSCKKPPKAWPARTRPAATRSGRSCPNRWPRSPSRCRTWGCNCRNWTRQSMRWRKTRLTWS